MPEIQMVAARPRTIYAEGDLMRTVAEFQSVEEVPSVDGEFKMGPVHVRTYMGRPVAIEGLPEVRCKVRREEPTEPPVFDQFEWG